MFLVGASNMPRKRKSTNRENPEKSGKSQKRTRKEGQVQIGKPPPRLEPLEFSGP